MGHPPGQVAGVSHVILGVKSPETITFYSPDPSILDTLGQDSNSGAEARKKWLNPLLSGLVFWKMKNKPVDSGPLNKNFEQPPEPDPIEEILEKMRERASKIGDATDVILEFIKNLPKGGTFIESPMFVMPSWEFQMVLHPGFVPSNECPQYPCSI